MRMFSGAVIAAAIAYAGPASADLVYNPPEFAVINAPEYSEAIYGTPDAPLYWSAPSFDDVRQVVLRAHLSDLWVSFDIKNATPGALVGLGQVGFLGLVAEDGTFSSGPLTLWSTIYDQGYGWLRVGTPLPAPSTTNSLDMFDIYNVRFSGFGPAAMPEPGAWALMIMGFGAAGIALRRRRAFA